MTEKGGRPIFNSSFITHHSSLLLVVAWLMAAACSPGGSRPPGQTTLWCEEDRECAQDLQRFSAGTLAPTIDFLREIGDAFGGAPAPPEAAFKVRHLKTFSLPASQQRLGLWASDRSGSGACFSVKLISAESGRTVWSEEGACDVRQLFITDQDMLVKIVGLWNPDQESHAGPHRLQINYYNWDAAAGAFNLGKTFETRQRF